MIQPSPGQKSTPCMVPGWKRGREEEGGEGEGYNSQGGAPQDAWRARAKQRSKLEPGPSPQHVM